MLLIKTYLAESELEGIGVFAAERVSTGSPVWALDPNFDMLVSNEKYLAAAPLFRDVLDRYSYPSADYPGMLVYEADNGKFMNHSEDPNTDFSGSTGGVALRDIAAHEEITCDYRQFHGTFELLPSIVPRRDQR